MDDPMMPKRPPIAALQAIAQYKSYRVWEAIDVYHAIWEALQSGDSACVSLSGDSLGVRHKLIYDLIEKRQVHELLVESRAFGRG